MATSTISLVAPNPPALEQMIMGYIAQGYVIMNRSPAAVTLFKKKEFSILWLVIGLILCTIPLWIYLIVYASESDKMVIIQVTGADPGAYAQGNQPQLSAGPSVPYGQQTYAPPSQPLYTTPSQPAYPAGAQLSPDGNYWWDGQAWQPVQNPSTSQPYQYPGTSQPYNYEPPR